MRVAGRFKAYFLRGLAVLLPSILTIWIFVWGYTTINQNISIHINRGLVRIIVLLGEKHIELSDTEIRNWLLINMPQLRDNEEELTMRAKLPEIRRKVLIDRFEATWVTGPGSIAGFIVALVSVCVIGAILASVVGKTLWRTVEKFIMNTPVLRRVYPYIKQVTDFLLAQEEQHRLPFSRVVAVEYPRKGIWSVGLVTGSGLKKVAETTRRELVTVLIPTSPTPFTGFVIMVPRKHTIDLDLKVEQAFRFIISGGVITPDQDRTAHVLPPAANNIEHKYQEVPEE
ncbi:MAG: DUF502 domain-containing protein [Phycisphaerales bacterium]|nr:MAG: DUF502 domain-containing protein [Phycisphaerales bacterium]